MSTRFFTFLVFLVYGFQAFAAAEHPEFHYSQKQRRILAGAVTVFLEPYDVDSSGSPESYRVLIREGEDFDETNPDNYFAETPSPNIQGDLRFPFEVFKKEELACLLGFYW